MQLPPEPKQGYVIAEWGRSLLRYLRGERLVSVVGGRLVESPNGKSIIIDNPSLNKSTVIRRLPFQIYSSQTAIMAEPGIFCEEEYPVTTEASPAEGTWYLQGLLVIDAYGAIVSTTVEWTQTEGTNTATDFYTTLGLIEVVAGDPDPVPAPSSIVQYQYGTITGIIHGAITDVWEVDFI